MVRIISYVLAFVLVFAGTILYNANRIGKLKRKIIHNYQSAMETLSSEMENISITLGKTIYTGAPATLTTLTNELILQAGTASSALAELPVKQEGVQTISKFLNQVSNYSLALTQNVVKGGSVTKKERDNLIKLSSIAKKLSNGLDETKTMYSNNEAWNQNIENALQEVEQLSDIENSFASAEQSLSDYPTLIYDGPFSDHILDKESELLKNTEEVNEERAKEIAAKKVGKDAKDLTKLSDENGKIPSFVFGFENGTISVTKQGGYVCYFRKEREIKSIDPDYEKALKAAKEYIDSLNIGSFATSYYFAEEGMCVVNFAYLQGDTICYSDLIKVGVALDNYDIIFYESRGYLMNHRARTLKIPSHTAESAKKVVSEHLSVKSTHLAVIPTAGKDERYCFEFLCVGEQNEEILVYINTDTLEEEQIFILLKTDGGVLTK